MVTKSKTTVSELMKQAQDSLLPTRLATPQIEQFWRAQDRILEDAEVYSRNWFARRHQAAQSALEAVREANGEAADHAAALQVMIGWQQHSMQRMTEDMQQWLDLCSRCASRFADDTTASRKGAD
ncbi:hypothetical protein OEW28_07350 [Defluviimonas sp. WL0002]|uniref:Phasin protein n=1 Tax=Albidovulum marisflavi TaxID=2984159 RepID=A0ABT2ZBK1_9RHOB|nr:hypothetical protein [Defluviimonas sp. WL0002]MCV2868442.1 hypothetical protein [Defluviimonas sp. WL0002]